MRFLRSSRHDRCLPMLGSIHDRPKEALDRTRVGHLEGDLIIGAMNRSALITVFDRA